MNKAYIDFLKYCLDDTLSLPVSSGQINWNDFMMWAESQAIVGVIYRGIEKSGKALNIPFEILMDWVGYAHQIENQNQIVNRECEELVAELNGRGWEICILKGQGNALMYPNPLLRTPGDIDVWVASKNISRNVFIREIVSNVKDTINPSGYALYHHIDYGTFGVIDVEIHYRPSYMSSPIHNRRINKWFSEQQTVVFNKFVKLSNSKVCVPTTEFNVVYLLSHMMRHLFSDGIGLRQIIDYYYLLHSKDLSGKEKWTPLLKELGLYQYAGALMYVLQETMGLRESKMIVQVDRRRGEFLLNEVLMGGNFGQFDKRKAVVNWNNPIGFFLRHLQRDMRLVRYFPSESLWEPIFRVYHHFWRMKFN